MGIAAALLLTLIIAYMIIRKRSHGSEYKKIQKLQQGTKEKRFSSEILFQKLYILYIRVPFIKRYILKVRRRLEIINIDDEYLTRRDSAKILTRALLLFFPLAVATIIITHTNTLLMLILLLFELFMIDTLLSIGIQYIIVVIQ